MSDINLKGALSYFGKGTTSPTTYILDPEYEYILELINPTDATLMYIDLNGDVPSVNITTFRSNKMVFSVETATLGQSHLHPLPLGTKRLAIDTSADMLFNLIRGKWHGASR